eukprot:2195059-Rhodomonas_salina.1
MAITFSEQTLRTARRHSPSRHTVGTTQPICRHGQVRARSNDRGDQLASSTPPGHGVDVSFKCSQTEKSSSSTAVVCVTRISQPDRS